MSNKFITLLEHIGTDIEKGLETVVNVVSKWEPVLDIGIGMIPGGAAVVPVFNATVAAITTVEQKFNAIGQANQPINVKAANVEQILGGIISNYLKSVGSKNTAQQYINAVYAILTAIPAPGTTVLPPAQVVAMPQASVQPSPVTVQPSPVTVQPSPVTPPETSINTTDTPYASNHLT